MPPIQGLCSHRWKSMKKAHFIANWRLKWKNNKKIPDWCMTTIKKKKKKIPTWCGGQCIQSANNKGHLYYSYKHHKKHKIFTKGTRSTYYQCPFPRYIETSKHTKFTNVLGMPFMEFHFHSLLYVHCVPKPPPSI